MSTFKARGVIIKETFVGESDKIITILCKELGKISVSAKGARKPKSKFMAGTQLFTYSDFIVFDGKKFLSLTQVDILNSFYEINTDYEKMCYGSYLLEMTDKIILPNAECDDELLLLLKALYVMCKGVINPQLVARIFELKFMEYQGFMPELNCCALCGKEIIPPIFFGSEGVVCKSCIGVSPVVRLSEGAIYTIRYVLLESISKLFSFSVSDEILRELEKACGIFITAHFDYTYKSLDLLKF